MGAKKRQELLSSVLPDAELARIDPVELQEAGNFKTGAWMCWYMGLMPITNWLISGIIPIVRSEFLNQATPGVFPEYPSLKITDAQMKDSDTMFYKRGVGNSTFLGTQFGNNNVSVNSTSNLSAKSAYPRSTFLKQADKKGNYQATLAIGVDMFTSSIGRSLTGMNAEIESIKPAFRQVISSYLEGVLYYVADPKHRMGLVKLFGDSFFDIQRPYQKNFKLKGKFSDYLRRATGVDPVAFVTKVMEELGVNEWIYSFGIEGYDDDPEAFTLFDLVNTYLEWLDENVKSFELISQPMMRGSLNSFTNQENNAVFATGLGDPELDKMHIRMPVRSNLSMDVGEKVAMAYTPREFFIDSVISNRDTVIHFMVDMPKAVAQYATQDDEVDEYYLIQMLDKAQLEVEDFNPYANGSAKSELELGSQSYGYYGRPSIYKSAELLSKRTPPATLGVNDKGLGLRPDGTIIYIPRKLNRLSKHREEVEEYFNAMQTEGRPRTISLRDPFDIPGNYSVIGMQANERPRPKRESLTVSPIYVDWGIGVLVGVDSNGAINKIMDVKHTTPLQDRHLAIYGSAAIIPIAIKDSAGWAKSYTDVLFQTKPNQAHAITDPMRFLVSTFLSKAVGPEELATFVANNAREIGVFKDGKNTVPLIVDDSFPDLFGKRIASFIRSADPIAMMASSCYNLSYVMYNQLRIAYGDETSFPASADDIVNMYHNGHGDYTTLKEVVYWSTSPCILTRILGFIIIKIWDALKTNMRELLHVTSVSQSLHYYGTLAAIAEVLNEPRPLTINGYDASKQPPADYVPEPLPGVREDYTALPHQVRVDYHMMNMARNDIVFRILHAQAGAGKTHNLLNDVMRQLQEGLVKKPLIICPNYLIKNYIEDSAYIYEGRFNVVPIDTVIKNYSPLLGNSETLNLEGILTLINSAPKNTIFITAFTFLSAGASSSLEIPMGLEVDYVNPHIEMLLEAGFDYVGADESQELRNEGTTKWDACLTLFYRARERVLATGTFLNTSPSDIPAQTVMLDPSIFGSHSDFFDYYAETEGTGKSARISRLRDGRKDELVQSLRTHLGYIQVKRKEWAALLPDRKDSYHLITLDPESGQWKIYQAILKQVLDEIKRILEQNKSLSRQAEDGDGEAEESLDNLLRPYLQRLEMLLITPELDKEYSALASELDVNVDEEYISPAIERAITIMRSHLNGVDLKNPPKDMSRLDVIEDARDYLDLDSISNLDDIDFIPAMDGKILVFCNYKTSVKAVYDALPPDLKKQAIAYDAALKNKHIFNFKNDPNKKILIGIQTSLATGHNFQFCTRLIRLEQVWSPGEVEQGESRLNRPDPKNKGKKRSKLFYDWIVVDGTIQVTKLSRLISRMIVNTQIDEYGNPAYKDVPFMPLLVMNLKTIQQNCWFHSPVDAELGTVTERSLLRYLEIKRDIDIIQKREFEQWRINYTGATEPVPIPVGPILSDSKLIANIPPIPGQVVAHADDLGCVNVAKYETLMGSQDVDLVGLRCYTPEGDGQIVKMSGTKLHVLINNQKYSFDRLAVSIYMDSQYSHKDIINSVGLKEIVTIDGSPYVLGKKSKGKKEDMLSPEDLYSKSVKFLKDSVKDEEVRIVKTKKSPVPQPTSSEPDSEIEVLVSNTNGALCLMVSSEDVDLTTKKATRLLNNLDFHLEPDCWYAEIPNRVTLDALIEKFEAKFNIPEEHLDVLYELQEAFSVGRKRLFNAEHSSVRQIREYWLMDYRRTLKKDPNVLVPIPCVQDGSLYIMLDMSLPSSRSAKRTRITNVSWESGGGFWMKLYSKKSECAADLRELQKTFTIANKDDLKVGIKEINILSDKKTAK